MALVHFLQAMSKFLEMVLPANAISGFADAINPLSPADVSTSYPLLPHKSPALVRHIPHDPPRPEQSIVYASLPSGAYVLEDVAQPDKRKTLKQATAMSLFISISIFKKPETS